MGMKDIVTALFSTPPVRTLASSLSRRPAGRRLLNRLSPQHGVYESFQDSWNAAAKIRNGAHEHPEAVERHVKMSKEPLPSDYAVLFWLNRIRGDLHVFDYGGNMGNVFYSCERYIDRTGRRLEWTVYDLPKVIEMGRELAARRQGEVPNLTTSLDDARRANVILVSGTYHYWEKDTAAFIAQFPHRPEHIIINRSPFYKKGAPVISMQSTLNFAFPIIVRDVNEVIDSFAAAGYELVDRWTAAEYGHVMPFYPEQSVKRYSGLYFRLRKSAGTTATAGNGKANP